MFTGTDPDIYVQPENRPEPSYSPTVKVYMYPYGAGRVNCDAIFWISPIAAMRWGERLIAVAKELGVTKLSGKDDDE